MALILRTLSLGESRKRRVIALLLLFGKEEELEKMIMLCFFVDFPSKNNPSVGNQQSNIQFMSYDLKRHANVL